jgi:hypothetical protein
MNSLNEIIPVKEIPDSEPWLSLRKGDAYQMGDSLIVGDQWLSAAAFHDDDHPDHHFKFYSGPTLIDPELDALLFLPRKRAGRISKSFWWEDFCKICDPLPHWDKTRWVLIVCVNVPYSKCWPQFGYALWDCKPDKFDEEGAGCNGCQMVEDETEANTRLCPTWRATADQKGDGQEPVMTLGRR